MNAERPFDSESPEQREERRRAFIENVRERSSKTTNEIRREFLNTEEGKRYKSLYRKADASIEEDRLFDEHAIDSEDLLDLSLSELSDFKIFGQPGVYSERTEQHIDRVITGLLWAIEYYAKKDPDWGFIKDLEGYAKGFQKATTPQEKLRVVHQILNAVHANAEGGNMANGAHLLVRDLQFGDVRYELLDFLSNELE